MNKYLYPYTIDCDSRVSQRCAWTSEVKVKSKCVWCNSMLHTFCSFLTNSVVSCFMRRGLVCSSYVKFKPGIKVKWNCIKVAYIQFHMDEHAKETFSYDKSEIDVTKIDHSEEIWWLLFEGRSKTFVARRIIKDWVMSCEWEQGSWHHSVGISEE